MDGLMSVTKPMTERVSAGDATGLRVTVLGCSGTYSSAESACSGYLVRTSTTAVLLDAGAGCSIELQRHLSLDQLDAIVISHEHPDHWTELPVLYHGFRFGIGRTAVPIYGTEGTRASLDRACPAAIEHTFTWADIDESSAFEIGDTAWTFSRTDHPVETLAARVESAGRSLAYSADTGPAWSPADIGMPIDLMLYEASLADDQAGSGIQHTSGREAGERAAAAGVRSLVRTPVPPGEDADERVRRAREVYDGSVELAAPGRTFFP